MVDPGVAWDKLSNFETAEEIREYFQHEGIKAIQFDANSCAIAQWFKNTTGEEHVSVAAMIKIGRMDDQDCWSTPRVSFEHTKATLDFIEKFDRGGYPELIDYK
jgi:hypothetical protein